ncbi:SH3 domain-containing protein [Jannaschia sp. 2305UL9-9]|uniref:SH3 domain-containing protein n=1 Tax=Jannaschia sp. 2305UL9-9 TaxID=3121638 RepID=UPI003529CBBA
MFKMTITLAAALYAGFIIWGEPETSAAVAGDSDAPVILATTSADYARPTILGLTSGDGEVVTRAAVTTDIVPDPATIAASAPTPTAVQPRLIGEPVVVSLVQPANQPAAVTAPETEVLLRVTGNRVNLRSGPSTSDRIVGSLTRDMLAEPIGEESNGWQEIRDVETGTTGFMAARFLSPS